LWFYIQNQLFNTSLSPQKEAALKVLCKLINCFDDLNTAKDLKINDYLLLSKGEAKDTGRARQYILADTVEAIIGAIYLDQGYEMAEQFIADYILYKVKEIVAKNLWQDAKSSFQEKAQEFTSTTPDYEVLSEIGPDHNKKFTVGVFIGDEQVATGDGHSKQEAEQKAAREGLEKKGWVE
jgi:ribonuclease-3